MNRPLVLPQLDELIAELRAAGRTVIGPTIRDGAIVLDEISRAAELPYGWGVESDGGVYRLHRRTDRMAFAHSAGPQPWKRFVHPVSERLWSGSRTDDGFTVTDTAPRRPLALLGVRPCDLRAIGVLDRVLGGSKRYATRRADLFIVAVNCTEPGAACFCVSAGGGPAVVEPPAGTPTAGAACDLVLTERSDGTCLAVPSSPAGAELLDRLPTRPADQADVAQAEASVTAAAGRMGRTLPPGNLRSMLAARREDPHWEDVAERCLACGNCTLVCPTCFCTTVTDTTDLTGDHTERWERWDSCFDLDFSYLHGGAVRTSTASRYRQWLSHKFGTWHDQFGESGCVGCGRCIVWCPVGIDVTAELAALATPPEGK